MVELIKVEVPASIEQDFNPNDSVWVDGKLRILRGTRYDTFFIQHETREIPVDKHEDEQAESEVRQAIFAFPIQVEKPATYDMVIDAAERTVYNLRNDHEANSFTASMSRKFRLDPQDPEVTEHDAFIELVKSEIKPWMKQ